MIKTLEKYLITLFLKKILIVSVIFFTLIFILNIFEEISFLKNTEANFFLPFLMTALNSPTILFEIFPFIFLLATQFFYIDLIEKGELDTLKINTINNFKLIKILFLSSFILGLILLVIYYNFSSKLKFFYLEIKNKYSLDNKYLAAVNSNGLWIKDESDSFTYIINADKIDNEYLKDVSISEFNKEFELIRIIESSKVNIKNFMWIIYNPKISFNNITKKENKNIFIQTHFNKKKINNLFGNLKSLNIFRLIELKKDYKELGYSTEEIDLEIQKLFSLPIYLSIMTIFSSIIMLNIKRNKPLIFHVFFGIFLSVLIYYFYYLLNLFGKSGKIPLSISVWLPLLILTIFILIGLIRINEK